MKSHKKMIVIAVLCTAAFSMAAAPAYAKKCQGQVVVSGEKKSTWIAARLSARKAWRQKARSSYGWGWGRLIPTTSCSVLL